MFNVDMSKYLNTVLVKSAGLTEAGKGEVPLRKSPTKLRDLNGTHKPPLTPPGCCFFSRKIILVGCHPTAVLITKAIYPLPFNLGLLHGAHCYGCFYGMENCKLCLKLQSTE